MALFITFEGPDGSGKSTQAQLLTDALRNRGHDTLETREPGGTELGEAIRYLLLDPEAPAATPLAMALLLSASRSQLVESVIRPALDAGRFVIADRYADSTVAYQGYGLGLDTGTVRELARIATGGLKPDATIYVDIEPEVGMERRQARGAQNRLDQEALAFHRRVRDGYLEMISEEPERWIYVDGDAPPEAVHAGILQAIEPLLESAA